MKSIWTTSVFVFACVLSVGCGRSSDPENLAEAADQSDLDAYREMQKKAQAGYAQSEAARSELDKEESKRKR